MGRWNPLEAKEHINYLELKAIQFALHSFFDKDKCVHIKIECDNVTAVSYLSKMGGARSALCNALSGEVWFWCITRQIWLTITHLPGSENIETDSASRKFNDDGEWSLQNHYFTALTSLWDSPSVDLFASRLNNKVDQYV